MDIPIGNISSAGLVRPAPAPVPAPAVPTPAPKVSAPTPQDTSVDANIAAAKAAQAAAQQVYAVSDKKFAIFKDASGQFVTRYVSLRDGSITYEPAPSFVKPLATKIAFNV